MVLVASRFHREVQRAGARILGGRSTGDDLKLIHSIEVDALRDDAVVALLVDGLGRHTVDIKLSEVVAGSADDRYTCSDLSSGCEGGKGGWIALRVVHLQGQIGVGGVLHHEADGGVGGI